jgi:transcription elongation factor Elf1
MSQRRSAERGRLKKDSRFDRILTVFTECRDCDALVLSYASAHFANAGHEDRRVLICDRCGTVFDVLEFELLLRSIPASWLLSKSDVAN